MGSVTTFGWDFAGGLATRTTGGNSKLYTSERTMGLLDTSGGVGASSGNLAALIVSSELFGSLTDEMGNTTRYTTDLYGGRLSETDALDNTTLYARDIDGLVIATTLPDTDGPSGEDPAVLEYERDELGNNKFLPQLNYTAPWLHCYD